ncbi:unnamed protein product [Arabis nemorensis]|uniref:Uncharacterized protein n=1 Tax=Arabis nemorensis TaxID=586526 RepID=A0A565CE01_9BRAS|nr:unnamed protein product [Arabis nemorensis]
MKQFDHGIVGLRTDLSPSAVASSSLTFTASKSENEDSFWGDYTVDLSFLSSDDQRSGLDDDDSLSNLSRDVDTTKGELFEKKLVACSILADECSKVAGDDKLDLSCANKAVLSEKQSTLSDQDDSEDTPCWIGLDSRSVTSRRSIDDLCGFYKLNPLAPHFIPSNSKKNIDTNGKRDGEEEGNSSSLKKSLSSDFPSSSGEFSITDPLEDGKNDAARRTVSILTNNADENLGFLCQDSLSKTVSMSDSRNEFQTTKKLDPLAPVFVPASAKLSPLVHEKQGAFDTNAHSTPALPSPESMSLNTLVETCSGEVGRTIKIRYPDGLIESGSTSSYNPWSESKVGITGVAKLGSSSNNSHGQRRLNPLAHQFSLADTKPKAYGYEKNQAADDLSLEVNTVALSPSIGYGGHNVVDADLAQSSVYVEHLVPNMSRGSSSLISSKTDGSLNRFGVEPNTTLSVKDSMDFKLPLPFHILETASSNDVKPFSGYGLKHSASTSSPSPKVDVKKLLTTMHGLSELLTLAHGSGSSDSPNSQELDLVNSTVQNLNSYIKISIQEQAGTQSIIRHNSYDLKLSPNKSKLSIRDLQLPRTNNMTVDLDVKRKEKYSMVSGETVPDSRLCEYVATKDNNFGQVVSGYQQDRQGEEQIHPHALFYKSLWLKAEADRCLMVYETSLSNPTS